jgi:hypothetical protein
MAESARQQSGGGQYAEVHRFRELTVPGVDHAEFWETASAAAWRRVASIDIYIPGN